MKPIDGIKRVSPYNSDAKLAYQTNDYIPHTIDEQEQAITNEVQQSIQNPYDNLDSLPYNVDARGYSNTFVNPQQAIAPFQELQNYENLSFYDFETLGVAPHQQLGTDPTNYFSMTEIGVSNAQYRHENGKHSFVNRGGANQEASILVRPNKATFEYANDLITRMGKGERIPLSHNDRRLIEDLTGYGMGAKTETRTLNGKSYTALIEQAQKSQIKSAQYSAMDIARARAGLTNLMKATPMDTALEVAATIIGTNRLAAFNNHSFDDPIFKHAIGSYLRNAQKNGKPVSSAIHALQQGMNTKKALDFYSAIKTTLEHPISQLSRGNKLFSGSLTLENLTNFFGARKGRAHTGIADTIGLQAVGSELMNVISNFSFPANANPMTSAIYKSSKDFGVNSRLFSTKGLVAGTRNPYDRVFQTGKEGELIPFDYSRAPITKRMGYTVKEIMGNVKLGGHSHVGVKLLGDDGLTSMIFRRTKEELMQTLHGRFIRGEGMDASRFLGDAMKTQSEYMKFFEGNGGFGRLQNAYAILDELGNRPATALDSAIASAEQKAGYSFQDSLKGRMGGLLPILQAEQDIWRPALASIGADPTLVGKAKTVALGYIKNQLGQNEAMVSTPNEKYLTMNTFGEDFTFRSGGRDDNRYQIRDFLRAGGNGMIADQKERLGSFITAATHQLNLSEAENALLKISEQSYHQALQTGGSVETAIDQIAQVVTNATNSKGAERLLMPVTHQVTDAHYTAIANAKNQLGTMIEQAKGVGSSLGRSSKLMNNSVIQNFVTAQDERIINMFKMYSGSQNTQSLLRGSYKTALQNLVGTYEKGFHVKLFTQNNSLAMVLLDKQADVSQLNGLDLAGFAKRKDAAIINLPGYTSDGVIEYGRHRRTNTFRAVMGDRQVKFSTSVIHALEKAAGEYDRVFKDVRSAQIANGQTTGGVGEHFGIVNRRINRRIRESIEKSVTQYNRGYDQQTLFETGSGAKNFLANSRIDVEDIAKQWYQLHIGEMDGFGTFSKAKLAQFGLHGNDKYSEVLLRNEAQGRVNFTDSMSLAAKKLFMLDVGNFIKQHTGVNTSFNAVNDRAVSNGLINFSNGDVRRIGFFSSYDEVANENLMKSVNTYRMNTSYGTTLQGEKASRTKTYLTNELSSTFNMSDVHYLQAQRIAMSDLEIKAALQDPAVQDKIRKKMKELNLPPSEQIRIETMMEQGRLSAYEGGALLSDKFKDAMSYTREIRVKLENGSQLSPQLQQLMLSADPNYVAGADFFSESGVNVRSSLYKEGKLTVGSMTIAGQEIPDITKKLLSNKKYSLKAYNASEGLLVFETMHRAEDALKTVSHTGDRNTNVFVPQFVIESITGIKGAEGILNPQKFSKGMGGSMVDGVIGYAMHHIEENFGNDTMKKHGLLQLMERHLGTAKGAVAINDEGQFVSQPGFENSLIRNGFSGSDFETFQQKVKAFLDPNNEFGLRNSTFLLKGDRIGIHNVWDTQHGSGEGRVYMGRKEAHVMSKKSAEFARFGVTGGDQYWASLQQVSSSNQHKEEAFGEMWRAIYRSHTAGGFTPGVNDVVFDLSSSARNVEAGAQIDPTTGALHVNALDKSVVHQIPQTTVQDLKYISDDYAQTLLNPRSVNLPKGIHGFNGQTTGEYMDYMFKNSKEHGLQFLKLPDVFRTASGSSYYVPLIHDESINAANSPIYLKGLQSNIRKLVEHVNAYNGATIGPSLPTADEVKGEMAYREGEIHKVLKSYEENLAYAVSSKEGTKDVFGGKVANSGHYQSTGIHPLDNYTFNPATRQFENNGLQENIVRMNWRDFADAADGIENNILKAWGITDDHLKDYAQSIKSNTALQQKHGLSMLDTENWTVDRRNRIAKVFVTEHANEKGIYGPAGRWPVIDKGTVQFVKFEIDDHVAPRSAAVTPGTAWRYNMDFDGDNFGVIFGGYADHNRAALNHNYAKDAFKIDQQVSQSVINEVMKDVLGELPFEKASMITVGDLTKKNSKDLAEATDLFASKIRERSEILTKMARLGKNNIGQNDNLGRRLEWSHYSLSRLAEQSELEGASSEQVAGIMKKHSERRAVVEEISRALSQDSINSKKLAIKDGDSALEPAFLQQEQLIALRRELDSPLLDIKKATSLFEQIGIYKFGDAESTIESYEEVNGRIQAVRMKQTDMVHLALTEIKKTNHINARLGYSALEDSIGHSQGQSMATLRSGIQNQPESFPLINQYMNQGADTVPFDDALALRNKARVQAYQNLENIGEAASEVLHESRKAVFSEPVSNASLSKGVSSAADNIMTQIAHIANNSHVAEGGGIGGKLGGIGLLFSSFALGTVAGASAPTPEGLQDMTVIQGKPQSQPTARIAIGPKNPQVTLKVSATSNRGHDPNDVASLVHHSVQEMSGLQMNQTVNVTDNSQNINQQWLQGIVANAMNSGYAR